MKKTLIFALAALATVATSQTMQQRKHAAAVPLTLKCVKAKAGGKKEITWQTDYGSQSRSNARTITYALQIRWNGSTPTNYTAQAYWVANAKETGDFVVETTYETIDLEPGKIINLLMTSPEIEEDKSTYAALGEKIAYGATLKGVMIRIVSNTDDANDYPLAGFTSASQWSKHIWAPDPNAQFKFNPSENPEKELLKKQLN